MILTDYYKFERVATRSKTRMDCTSSTASYPTFEEKRSTRANKATEKRDPIIIGSLIIYYGDVPESFGGDKQRKADKSLSMKGQNLSSIYIPDIESNYGFGDVKNTADAMVFVFDNWKVINGVVQPRSTLEIFIARGQAENTTGLYNQLSDGVFDEEMNRLREKAKQEHSILSCKELPNQ